MPSQAAILIPNEKVAAGEPVGNSLIVINSPGPSELPLDTNGADGVKGPTWADVSANGWRLTDRGVVDSDTQGTSPWEPDGSATQGQLRFYRNGGGNPVITTYTFNLADSGIDLPDGAVIHGIYATWTTRGTSGGIYSHTVGETTSSEVTVSHTSAPTADLAINWTDNTDTVRTANFQRIFEGPIEVEGGNGLVLNVRRSGNTHQTDAVILDVTLPALPSEIFQLTITPNGPDFDFEWASLPGKLYDLLTSTDLADPISVWPVYSVGETPYEAIPSAGETTTLTAVPSADPRRFFAVREYDAPPPPLLFDSDFEDDNGGFTVVTPEGNAWQWGTPDSSGPGGVVNSGNGADADTGRCWGTNLGAWDGGDGDSGFYANPTTTRLRSPVIDLTEVAAAELSFYEALDLPASDSAVVNIIADTVDTIIAEAIHTSVDGNLASAEWTEVSGISLSAGIGQQVRIEWVLEGTGAGTVDYMGWYIDDVIVTEIVE